MRAAFREGLGCVILAPDQTVRRHRQAAVARRRRRRRAIRRRCRGRMATPWRQSPLPVEHRSRRRCRLRRTGRSTASRRSRSRSACWWCTRATDHPRALRAGRGHDDADADVVDGEEHRLDADRHPGRSGQAAARRAARHRVAAGAGRGGAASRIPRSAITLRHVLNMSSGLETVDNGGLEYATGSGTVVLGGRELRSRRPQPRRSSASPARRGTTRTTTRCSAVYAMKRAIGSDQDTSSSRARRCSTRSACATRSSAPTGSATSS